MPRDSGTSPTRKGPTRASQSTTNMLNAHNTLNSTTTPIVNNPVIEEDSDSIRTSVVDTSDEEL